MLSLGQLPWSQRYRPQREAVLTLHGESFLRDILILPGPAQLAPDLANACVDTTATANHPVSSTSHQSLSFLLWKDPITWNYNFCVCVVFLLCDSSCSNDVLNSSRYGIYVFLFVHGMKILEAENKICLPRGLSTCRGISPPTGGILGLRGLGGGGGSGTDWQITAVSISFAFYQAAVERGWGMAFIDR